jgi:DNA-binding phage protein
MAWGTFVSEQARTTALSPRVNPRFSTLLAVTKAMGLTLTVEPAHA